MLTIYPWDGVSVEGAGRMRQIVGLSCAICRQAIGSILEGEFCPACGGPVHQACRRPQATAEGTCQTCGGDLAHFVVVEARREKEREAARARLAPQEPRWRFGFPLLMLLGFACGACPAVASAVLLAAQGDRFSYATLVNLLLPLGAVGVYVGHIVGAVRYKEAGFRPLGPLTAGVLFLGATIVIVGSAAVLGAVLGIMTLAKGPPPH
jgi:hypothetical protein